MKKAITIIVVFFILGGISTLAYLNYYHGTYSSKCIEFRLKKNIPWDVNCETVLEGSAISDQVIVHINFYKGDKNSNNVYAVYLVDNKTGGIIQGYNSQSGENTQNSNLLKK